VTLTLTPVTLRAARAFIGEHHSHNLPPRAWKFGTSVLDDDGAVAGVGVAGRPKGRGFDDGRALEVLRVCTMGLPNACSKIYAALCRAGFALGHDPIYTYTLARECASCVKAAGFTVDAVLDERDGWDTPARPRVDVDLFGDERTPTEAKVRWIRRRRLSLNAPQSSSSLVLSSRAK
jgi:hypothetical protein